MRAFVQEVPECRIFLKLHFANAFNTVRRDELLRAVKLHLPDYYAFIWLYGNATKIPPFFGMGILPFHWLMVFNKGIRSVLFHSVCR